MCNCKNKASRARRVNAQQSGSQQQFVLIDRNGKRTQYGSRLEADAENARAGYTGIVKPLGG